MQISESLSTKESNERNSKILDINYERANIDQVVSSITYLDAEKKATGDTERS